MAKTFTGTVSSAAADKTIVVTVNRSKTHPLYHKQFTVSKKFMAHDEKNEAQVGDRVLIAETKPFSKRKTFVLSRILEKAAVRHTEAAPEIVAAIEVAKAEPAVEAKAPKAKKADAKADKPAKPAKEDQK